MIGQGLPGHEKLIWSGLKSQKGCFGDYILNFSLAFWTRKRLQDIESNKSDQSNQHIPSDGPRSHGQVHMISISGTVFLDFFENPRPIFCDGNRHGFESLSNC